MMDTKLKKLTTFDTQKFVQIEVVNKMIIHILCMYNSKHLYTWDENVPYV